MPQGEYRVTISIQRAGKALDGKAGHSLTWPPAGGFVIYTGPAFKHFYAARTLRGQTDEQGPGMMTVRERFYEIRGPLPALVKKGDRIVDSDGETYRIKLPERRYGRKNLQLDCELIA